MKHPYKHFPLFILMIFSTSGVYGQAVTAIAGNWNTAANWSPASVPGSTTPTTVMHAMNLNQNLSIQAKYIFNANSSGSASVNMSADSLIINADVSFGGGGNNLTGGVILVKSGHTFTIGGFATGGSFKLVIEPGATVVVNGGINNNGGTFQVDGTMNVNGSYSAANSSGNVTGSGSFTTTGSMTSMNGGAIFGNPNTSCSSNCNGNSLCGTTVTINPVSASLCLGENVSFSSSVTPASTSYEWQSSATGSNFTAIGSATTGTYSGIPSASTYYRLKVVTSGCITISASTQIMVNALPAGPTVPDGERCGDGAVTMTATGSTGSYEWYDDALKTNLLDSDDSYTTLSLTASTDYFVIAINGSTGCESDPVQVTANINSVPVTPASSDATRCGEGTVTLDATGSTGDYKWYDDASKTNLLSSDDSYTTASLSSDEDYYLAGVDLSTGCESSLLAVNVTIQICAGVTESTEAMKGIHIFVSGKDLYIDASAKLVTDLRLYNTQGRMISVQNLLTNKMNIVSLENVQEGIYVVQMNVDGTFISEKILIE